MPEKPGGFSSDEELLVRTARSAVRLAGMLTRAPFAAETVEQLHAHVPVAKAASVAWESLQRLPDEALWARVAELEGWEARS